MIRRFGICLLVVMGLVSLHARGDVDTAPPATQPDPGITEEAKTAPKQADYLAEIAQKVSDEVNKLAQNPADQATVAMVRTWLVQEDPPTASPPYQEAYTQALNKAFLNALSTGDPSLNTKVNIGLVIKSLTGSKMNLSPTAEKLLADKCPAVVYMGEKAAKEILPLALQNPNFPERDHLLAAIVGGVKANPDPPLAPLIAEEAYSAINPKQRGGTMPQGANLSALVDCNLSLLKARLDIYQNNGIPAFPTGDTYPSFLLFSTDVWGAMNNAQQLQAVQLAVNLVSLIEQRSAMPGQPTDQTRELVKALNEEGKWLEKLGEIIQDQQLQAVSDQLYKLQQGASPATIKADCDAVVAQVIVTPTLASSLTSPPTISPK